MQILAAFNFYFMWQCYDKDDEYLCELLEDIELRFDVSHKTIFQDRDGETELDCFDWENRLYSEFVDTFLPNKELIGGYDEDDEQTEYYWYIPYVIIDNILLFPFLELKDIIMFSAGLLSEEFIFGERHYYCKGQLLLNFE